MSASQMIRVPTALVAAVRELSRLHRSHHTEEILETISALIAKLDSSDIRADSKTDGSDSNADIKTDSSQANNDIRVIIQRLESRVMALETEHSRTSPTVGTPSTAIAKAPPQKESVNRPTPNTPSGLLTTSEAFAELKRRGWRGENTTLRRKLRDGIVPPDLQRFRLMVDTAGFKQRRETPKDNRVAWLSFLEP